MSNTVIKVEHISKSYILKHQNEASYTALRDVISNKAKSLFSSNTKGQRKSSEEFLALNDISFDIKQGDRVGIIGRNGAGKSTLLKVLSRIVTPTKGKITIDGRVASLLEVGTGFHPELSGRENIFLNGSILGMSKIEIQKKFDEIVSFSEVERFLDTPVKRYSSGMYVRLAFAVAAHLEPEILIVDEVLAVGDAEFQKKCLGKMKDVSGEGRTVLFVSHNMVAVKSLCSKGIVLEKGAIKFDGNIDEALDVYNSNISNAVDNVSWAIEDAPGNENAKITSIKFKTAGNYYYIENEIEIEIEFYNFSDNHTLNASISIFDDKDVYVFASPNLIRIPLTKGIYKSVCKIPKNLLNKSKYFCTVLLVGNNFEIITQLDKVISIDVDEEGTQRGNYFGYWGGVVRPHLEWQNIQIDKL